MKPKVSIIVLNWNGGANTIACLESLKRINYPNYNILVVDNGSTDGSVKRIKEGGSTSKGIKITQNKENLGFAEGMNVGIREVQPQTVQSDYVLTLNQDTVVHPDFIQELIEVAEADSSIGIVGPKIYYYNGGRGEPELIYSCGTRYATGSVFKIKIPYIVPLAIGRGEEDVGQYNKLKSEIQNPKSKVFFEVPAITGCCMLIKREVIQKIGLFDSQLFIFREDDDYCIRARRAGYKTGYKICVAPKSIIWHKTNMQKEPSYKTYYRIRNWLLVIRKHFGQRVFAKILLAHISKMVRAPLFILVCRGGVTPLLRTVSAYLFAYLDALTLRTPKRFLR